MASSGNKIRKLTFLLAEALHQKANMVLTCGGIQSNHCRSTAVAARRLGLDTSLLLRTKDPTQPLGWRGNLLIDQLMGAHLVPINYEQYGRRRELLEELAEEWRDRGKVPYIIPEGGSNALGTWGYIEAVREITTQVQAQNIHITDLVLACGSGGTAAGISLASHLSQAPWKVHAINVCDDAPTFYGIINEIYQGLGFGQQAESCINLIDGHKGEGYAVSTTEELSYQKDIARQTGVILDPVYTGKAMVGLQKELTQRPEQFKGRHILFLHTGGLFGLFAKAEQLQPLLPTQELTNWSQGR